MVLLVPSDTAPFLASARPMRFALSTSVELVRVSVVPPKTMAPVRGPFLYELVTS